MVYKKLGTINRGLCSTVHCAISVQHCAISVQHSAISVQLTVLIAPIAAINRYKCVNRISLIDGSVYCK